MTFPTVRPARPAYPPPIPSGFIDPGGKTPVEKALRTQAAVHKIYSDWRAAHSKDIDPDVLKRNAGAFSVSDAALALPEAVRAVDWKAATAPQATPQPPTAAVPVPSASRIVQMLGEAPDDWMAAWRAGQLAGRGAPAPPPRRIGGLHRNAAP